MKGTSFIRYGQSKSIVDLDFGDGHTLTWEKGRGKGDKPTYIVDGGNPLYPGQAVPEEVRDLGVKPILLGGKEIWPQLAPQFTGQLFLLDQPGSVMAEAVADVERVGQLNEALRMAGSDRRLAASELQVRRGDVEQLGQELKRFEALGDTENLVLQAEEATQRVQKIEGVLARMRLLGARYKAAKDLVLHLSGVERLVLPAEEAVAALVTLQAQLEDIQRVSLRYREVSVKVTRLMGVSAVVCPEDKALRVAQESQQQLELLVRLRVQQQGASKRVQKYQGIENFEVPLDTAVADRCQAALVSIRPLQDKLKRVQESLQSLQQELRAQEAEEVLVSGELLGALGALDTCPVCGAVTHSTH